MSTTPPPSILKASDSHVLLMVLRYDNGDTKPVYRELTGCSQVEAVLHATLLGFITLRPCRRLLGLMQRHSSLGFFFFSVQ